ncbi:hypothetical protein INT47_005433 [Mucor saturninus]|uniref:Uncharacterized protein n=1 Tax=Mucor saturninus TaxID=64648 RepID=A0A8H7QVY0_9FUNG|nr:hypothetical protein INT47_005433 [Mucor saturninus]
MGGTLFFGVGYTRFITHVTDAADIFPPTIVYGYPTFYLQLGRCQIGISQRDAKKRLSYWSFKCNNYRNRVDVYGAASYVYIPRNMTRDASKVVIIGGDPKLGGGVAGRWLMVLVLLIVLMTQKRC